MTASRRGRRAVALGASLLLLVPTSAHAGEPHDVVVSENPRNRTPVLQVTEATPHPVVEALADLGDRVVVAGRFDTVTTGGRDAGTVARDGVMIVDEATGTVSPGFAPVITRGRVRAVEADPATDAVFLGGDFKEVDGTWRPAIAKVDAATGALVETFAPPITGGRVHDLDLVTIGGVQHLLVSGNPARKITSLDPRTGRNDGFFRSSIAGKLDGTRDPNATVYSLDVDPAGQRAVAVGNFSSVDGQLRARFAMFDLTPDGATLSDWYYPGFRKLCASTRWDRIAYLADVDFSPDGTAFSIASTGFVPRYREDIWYQRLGDRNRAYTSTCDSISRFRVADDQRPQWINYTGGDTVWAVEDTGPAVYGYGHFRWLDNPDGRDTKVGDASWFGKDAVDRRGIGAVDPGTGLALPFDPKTWRFRIGGKAILSTDDGIWFGGDSEIFGGERHRGLAFLPLP